MSSLAAARADNFYFPTDYDPNKHKSLNHYHGTHALRDRAKKIDQGILVIRFEVPFHLWCGKCGEKIAKGERFNAEKQAIGNYHSTKIWQFSMRHHCGSVIVIQSDPKKAEYLVVEGARKKVEDYKAEDAGTVELASAAEREKVRSNAFSKLEHAQEDKRRARTAAEEVADLLERNDAVHMDPLAVNKALRKQLRAARREDAALEAKRRQLHLPDAVRLLPHSEADTERATLMMGSSLRDDVKDRQSHDSKRRDILSQSIFSNGGASSGSGRAGGGAGSALGPSTSGRGPAAGGGGAAAAAGGARTYAAVVASGAASGPAGSAGSKATAMLLGSGEGVQVAALRAQRPTGAAEAGPAGAGAQGRGRRRRARSGRRGAPSRTRPRSWRSGGRWEGSRCSWEARARHSSEPWQNTGQPCKGATGRGRCVCVWV